MVDIQDIKRAYGVVGNSAGLNMALGKAVRVAPTELNVLITGESGVGKEVFPRIIHDNSNRRRNKYIAINCGAIPEGTIDSELFGHEKGSFTGAISAREGYFEVADGGTIFLDEVGELPMPTQARLLRVLETGEFIRVGSSEIRKTNVRVVAATNVKLQEAIELGKFREDLYYRLNTIPITIPPLRERPQDIALLFRKFSADFSETYGTPELQLTDEARDVLIHYYWRGNVRELKNVTERLCTFEQGHIIDDKTLKKYLSENAFTSVPALSASREGSVDAITLNSLVTAMVQMKQEIADLKVALEQVQNGSYHPTTNHFAPVSIAKTNSNPIGKYEHREIEDGYAEEVKDEQPRTKTEVERELYRQALERNHYNRTAAAKELGVSERTIYRKIKDYNL
ncbi:MAG: sigma-54-dependent Fis family transcriptional regulator [Paludibacteraceae bacterium]|nr:sigma-54-dependent Fis family transcriptional regulator [Paludibacteraceae bacterium]